MGTRLIPWCLAATGFVAAFTAFTWQGKPGVIDPPPPPPVAVRQPIAPSASDHLAATAAPVMAAAAETPETAPAGLVLPLPPATQPETDPNVRPVPDDEPTVEDLPAPHDAADPRADTP